MEDQVKKFVAAHTGEANLGDTTGNKGECVGVIEVWLDEHHYPHIWGNAIDLLNNADPNFFEITHNDPYNFPVPGDIAVFGEPFGKYIDNNGRVQYDGHTGLVVAADANVLTLFEANNPTGAAPRLVNHSYNAVLGWIHLKPAAIAPTPPAINTQPATGEKIYTEEQYQACMTDRQKFWQERDELQKKLDAVQAIHSNFVTLGYNTVEDVTKALKAKDDKYLQLQQDQIIIEKKNETLANLLGDDSKKNYTAMETASDQADKLQELENGVAEMAKEVGVKATLGNVFDRLLFLKTMAERYIKSKEDAAHAKETTTATPPQTSSRSIIAQIFNL
jgi:hypothetical protein